jgi:hypothetical protein
VRNLLKRNIVGGLVLSCLVFPFGSLAFAASVDPGNPNPNGAFCQPPDGRPDFVEHIEAGLTNLVSDGTITVEQKDALVNFFKEKDKERKAAQDKKHDDMLQEITRAGQLTPEQTKKVDDALRPPLPPGGPQGQLSPNHPPE